MSRTDMLMYSAVVIGWAGEPPLGTWGCHVEETCLGFQHRPRARQGGQDCNDKDESRNHLHDSNDIKGP